MKIFDWLCGLLIAKPVNKVKNFSIPRPDGWPIDGRPARPKVRGKSKEQRDKEYAEYVSQIREDHRKVEEFNRKQAISVGVKYYIWKSVTDQRLKDCSICMKRSGKKYSYSKPTPDGFPGEGKCGRSDFCYARAHPIIK